MGKHLETEVGTDRARFSQIMEQNQLEIQEGLVSWNMLGFTTFEDLYSGASHEQTQKRMIESSEQLFNSSRNA